MKKILLSFLAVSVLIPIKANHGKGYETSRSFFSVVDQFRNASPEKESMFRNDWMEAAECGIGGCLQAVIFGGSSFNESNLAEYFMPFGKSALSVIEFGPDGQANKDIEARNFNIVTNDFSATAQTGYKGIIRFRPKQDVVAIGLDYRQKLSCKDNGRAHFWFEISFPIERVVNTMGFTEEVESDGGGTASVTGLDDAPAVGNMTEAFDQPNWQYGKIKSCHKMTKWGVADIEIKIGHNPVECEDNHLRAYLGIVVPTGNKPNARYVFQPIIGNNHHWGAMFGGNYGFVTFKRGKHTILTEIDVNSRFLFSNHQSRSFDLIDKQWSRYLATYLNQEQASLAATDFNAYSGTSGINVFTACFKVSPRFMFDINSAIVYNHSSGFIGEAGYNFLARQAEEVRLKNKWNSEAQIKSIDGFGLTNIYKNITNNLTAVDSTLSEYDSINCIPNKF